MSNAPQLFVTCDYNAPLSPDCVAWLCKALKVREKAHVVDLGCGWGQLLVDIVMHLQLGPLSGSLSDGSPSWNAAAKSALEAWNPHMERAKFTTVMDSTVPIGSGNGVSNVIFSDSIFGRAFGDTVLLTPLLHALAVRWGQPVDLLSSGPWTPQLLAGNPQCSPETPSGHRKP